MVSLSLHTHIQTILPVPLTHQHIIYTIPLLRLWLLPSLFIFSNHAVRINSNPMHGTIKTIRVLCQHHSLDQSHKIMSLIINPPRTYSSIEITKDDNLLLMKLRKHRAAEKVISLSYVLRSSRTSHATYQCILKSLNNLTNILKTIVYPHSSKARSSSTSFTHSVLVIWLRPRPKFMFFLIT